MDAIFKCNVVSIDSAAVVAIAPSLISLAGCQMGERGRNGQGSHLAWPAEDTCLLGVLSTLSHCSAIPSSIRGSCRYPFPEPYESPEW